MNFRDLIDLQTSESVVSLNEMLNFLFNIQAGDGDSVRVFNGFGTPEGAVVASVGSLYLRKDGGSGTSVYKKETGTGATGWVAITDTVLGVKNSIEIDSSEAQLVNDADDPGNSKYYGTDSGGTKGFFDVPLEVPDWAAGDVLLDSADTERGSTDVAYTKYKEFKLSRQGTLRIKFSLKSSNGTNTVYGRVYRNGVAVGTEQSDITGAYVLKSEDIAGWSKDDLCQLYLKTTGGATSYAKEFRLYADRNADTGLVTD